RRASSGSLFDSWPTVDHKNRCRRAAPNRHRRCYRRIQAALPQVTCAHASGHDARTKAGKLREGASPRQEIGMQEGDYPLTLSEIAENAAFSMSDVAFIAGLEESTVYRLWENPNWLEKVSGKSLQALIATVPGLGEYVATYSVQTRR